MGTLESQVNGAARRILAFRVGPDGSIPARRARQGGAEVRCSA